MIGVIVMGKDKEDLDKPPYVLTEPPPAICPCCQGEGERVGNGDKIHYCTIKHCRVRQFIR